SGHTDGPGSLLDFIGEEAQGAWMLTMTDNALSHTGRVDDLIIHLEPQIQTNNGNGGFFSVGANAFVYDAVDVPPEAISWTINISSITNPTSLELYVRRSTLPS